MINLHTTFNITIMIDLFLIAMAVVNALLLLAFYRILHVNPEAKNKIFYFQFNDGLDFINYLAKDFLFFMILAHLMLFCGLGECLSPHRGRHPDHNTEIPETPPAFAVTSMLTHCLYSSFESYGYIHLHKVIKSAECRFFLQVLQWHKQQQFSQAFIRE